MEIRDYQEKAIQNMRIEIKNGNKRIVFACPTGSGKSVVFGQVIKNAYEKHNSVLWLVHRRNLVLQMKETLEKKFGLKVGVIMSGYESNTDERIQIGTIQTYARRLKLDDPVFNRFFINADVVLVDEGHRSISKSYKDVLDLYKDKIILACTATPMRADGRGLGEIYQSIVDIVGVKELTEKGFLAPARYFAPFTPDLSDVKIAMGDYVVKDLEKKINKPKLVGDIVENWLKYGENRRTIVFCVNVKHSIAVCEAFNRAGVQAEQLSARSSDEERNDVFRRMEDGDTRVVCNVALYQEGLDVPNVTCIIMARSTKSMGLYRQCLGRGLRPSPYRDDCLIFDHGGTIEQNGFLDVEIEWSLDGKKKAWKVKKTSKIKKPVKCQACHLIFEGLSKCPDCGSPVKSFGKKIETAKGDLKELNGKRKKSTPAEKRQYLGMLKYWVSEKGYNPKMITAKYKTKFECWPHHSIKNVSPIVPDKNFINLMKHDFIRYSKRKRVDNR